MGNVKHVNVKKINSNEPFLGSHGGVGFFNQVPQAYLIFDKLSSPKIFLDLLPNVVGLFLHLLDHVFLPSVVLVLTTRLQVNLEKKIKSQNDNFSTSTNDIAFALK